MAKAYACCRVCRGPWNRFHSEGVIEALERLDYASHEPRRAWSAIGRAQAALESFLEPAIGAHVDCLVGVISGVQLLHLAGVDRA